MSRFYGTVNGSAQTEATRRGTEKSGLSTYCNTWTIGVQCTAYVNGEGSDAIAIYLTDGSGGRGINKSIGTVVAGIDGQIFFKPADTKEIENGVPT